LWEGKEIGQCEETRLQKKGGVTRKRKTGGRFKNIARTVNQPQGLEGLWGLHQKKKIRRERKRGEKKKKKISCIKQGRALGNEKGSTHRVRRRGGSRSNFENHRPHPNNKKNKSSHKLHFEKKEKRPKEPQKKLPTVPGGGGGGSMRKGRRSPPKRAQTGDVGKEGQRGQGGKKVTAIINLPIQQGGASHPTKNHWPTQKRNSKGREHSRKMVQTEIRQAAKRTRRDS